MCGRYFLLSPAETLAVLYVLQRTGSLPNWPPSTNVAPTDRMPVVRRNAAGARELVLLRWGLVPGWAKDISIGSRTINARSESVAEKPSFRDAYRQRRCLVPADGWYEWVPDGKKSRPVKLEPAAGGVVTFAGLWERWTRPADVTTGSARDQGPKGEVVETFTILTTSASAAIENTHDRMPVVLAPDQFDLWLDGPGANPAAFPALFRPAPLAVTITPVGTAVNSVRNTDLSVLEPVAPPAPRPVQGSLF